MTPCRAGRKKRREKPASRRIWEKAGGKEEERGECVGAAASPPKRKLFASMARATIVDSLWGERKEGDLFHHPVREG